MDLRAQRDILAAPAKCVDGSRAGAPTEPQSIPLASVLGGSEIREKLRGRQNSTARKQKGPMLAKAPVFAQGAILPQIITDPESNHVENSESSQNSNSAGNVQSKIQFFDKRHTPSPTPSDATDTTTSSSASSERPRSKVRRRRSLSPSFVASRDKGAKAQAMQNKVRTDLCNCNEAPFHRPSCPARRGHKLFRSKSHHSPSGRGRFTPTSSRPSSPGSGRGTPTGTAGSTDDMEKLQKKIRRVQRMRLYLLQQSGPNSLLVGGDSPDDKHRVFIGQQSCSCGKHMPCVHLLFIMLRVFQVAETNPLLQRKTLRNYEVESLFRNFEARKRNRVWRRRPSKTPDKAEDVAETGGAKPEEETSGDEKRVKPEDDTCPICLLEMVDGESLTSCDDGCNNQMHHQCVAVWAEACKRQGDPFSCPLCRAVWTEEGEGVQDVGRQAPPNTRAPSPVNPLPGEGVHLPHSEPIPPEQRDMAAPWIELFGYNLVSCLLSREWTVREAGLMCLSHEVARRLLQLQEEEGEDPAQWTSVLRVCCNILTMKCQDPVYNVYVASLRSLRDMVAYTLCRTEEQVSCLQDMLRPVVDVILIKCTDGARRKSRTCQLSLSTLLELAKGQEGGLATASELPRAESLSVGSLPFLLSCILSPPPAAAAWQYFLGRLNVIERIIEDFPNHFVKQGSQSPCRNDPPFDTEPLASVLSYVCECVKSPHPRLAKQSKDLFLKIARWVSSVPSVFKFIFGILSTYTSRRHANLMENLLALAAELGISKDWLLTTYPSSPSKSPKEAPLSASEESTPYPTPGSTPHYNTPSTSPGSTVDIPAPMEAVSNPAVGPAGVLTPPPSPVNSARNVQVQVTDVNAEQSNNSERDTTGEGENVEEVQRENREIMNGGHNNNQCNNADQITVVAAGRSGLRVSFESEVAPGFSASSTKALEGGPVAYSTSCKEQVEVEEAQALAVAMEMSTLPQQALPRVPGLTRRTEEKELIIHVQPKHLKGEKQNAAYREEDHWLKGTMIGTGAFSTCYQARDVQTGTIMACKQVSFCRNSPTEQEKVAEEIRGEIQLMARLDHPNIVRVLGATQEGTHFNIFQEWMPGGSVAGLLDQYGAFSDTVIKNLTRQILLGVSYLHDNCIIHRDIKGANLLVDSTGTRLRIADFGTAARLATKLTGAGEFQGQLLGTIAFMAPEVLRGEQYGRSCDVWSIGCTVIEMGTASPPWNANAVDNHLALIFRIASSSEPPPLPTSFSPGLRDLVLRCLEQKSADRPSTRELLQLAVFNTP